MVPVHLWGHFFPQDLAPSPTPPSKVRHISGVQGCVQMWLLVRSTRKIFPA